MHVKWDLQVEALAEIGLTFTQGLSLDRLITPNTIQINTRKHGI